MDFINHQHKGHMMKMKSCNHNKFLKLKNADVGNKDKVTKFMN